MLVIGFKLVAGAIASNAFTGVAIGVGFIFASYVNFTYLFIYFAWKRNLSWVKTA